MILHLIAPKQHVMYLSKTYKMTKKISERLILQSQRRWLDLKHIDFRAIAYRIPFTLKQLDHMNWSHRYLVQRLVIITVTLF